MISGFLNLSPSRKTNCLIFGDTRTPKTNQEKTPNIKNNIMCINLGILKLQNVDIFRKDGAPKNDKDSSQQMSKIFDMGPISSWKREMIFWEYPIPIIYKRIIH